MKTVPFITAVAVALSTGIATAQEAHPRAVEFTAGALMFADDGIVTEGMVGAAARYYVSPRIGFGPEIVFVQGQNHNHVIATGNLTFDFVSSAGGRKVIPFVVAGGGIFHTRDRAPRGGFNSSEGALTGGGGVRGLIHDRVYIGAEARVGWELHIRLNGIAAWTF